MTTDLIPQTSQFLLYTTPEGDVKMEVLVRDETVWLTQKAMAELFDVEVNTVNYHLKETFRSGELQENSVIRKFRITASDAKEYLTNFYNLDAIISVGYRVNSQRATQFRIWATRTRRAKYPRKLPNSSLRRNMPNSGLSRTGRLSRILIG